MQTSSRAFALWLLGTGLSLVVGCTHQDPADRSVEKLRADIVKMEADRDRLDQRVGALEAEEQRRRDGAEAQPGKTPIEPARRLPVVRVGEGDAPSATLAPPRGEAPDLDTGSAELRPAARAGGSRASADHRSSKEGGDEAVVFSPEAKRDYDGALALARSKQYDKALQSFTAFLVRYPDHPLVENAMYWRGECFFATGVFARAAEQFEGQIARFPFGNKAADALLKLGRSQEKLGAEEQAQKTFAELADRYPKSDAARQAPHP